MPESSPRIPVEERLFSLVLALLATEGGLTKAEILSSVQGYRQRYAAGGDNASLERQFERDKDDIRDLGIPLEASEAPEESGDNHNLRYRIPKGAYDLPRDIDFDREESALIGLAATLWREGALSAQSRRALMKLRSIGADPAEPIFGLAPRLSIRESAFAPLESAMERSLVVRFPYLKPGEADARLRTVEPFALVQHGGRWLVNGLDRDAGARRTFLLSRIVGEVATTSEGFARPAGDLAREALAELDRLARAQAALVRVEPGTDAAVRLTRRGTVDKQGLLTLHYTDAHLLADELCGYGPEVVVVEPAELRALVLDRLERVAADHTDGDTDRSEEGGHA